MKTAFINLPYKRKIVRRYNCVYNASNFLLPPLELMSMAAMIKVYRNAECFIIDAVAKHFSIDDVNKFLNEYKPDMIVCLLGIETFSEDVETVNKIKNKNPQSKIVCLGYLSSLFPKETLKNAPFIDYLILGEPENVFKQLFDSISEYKIPDDIKGIAFLKNDELYVSAEKNDVYDLDMIPMPAWSLVDINDYNEFFSARPFAAVQTSRGCSCSCKFCIPTYGNNVRYRSVDNVINEIKYLLNKDVETIRFLDDNFCANTTRLSQICTAIIHSKLRFKWSCLSRPDNLDESTIKLMKEAGCFRIYFGVETFSSRLLESYGKKYSVEKFKFVISVMKKNHIESTGFFMISPDQTREEFDNDLSIAQQIGLDFAGAARIVAYPGTKYFEDKKDSIEFSLFPYKNELKDKEREKELLLWEKDFYKEFYFNWKFFVRALLYGLMYPMEVVVLLKDFLGFVPGKQAGDQARNDFI